ncbi:glycosyl hydrolase family 28-related protein [Azospirillum picis]|uniref:Rhamnogalacturonase A/B/Epimerase-like pectate lyase domain-containing protein n=1 Tax=Azospirillum picis TaxID=488438 RepID=A0ABU0MPK5_9PROT|nr:glycosyl hydrolase family 28-related protein [Azospirillum picis]MBP2301572.1 hypothetical protein [Azospirillum picis]MDQ0535404.1 hypothetical protein [Azospirillum picis]
MTTTWSDVITGVSDVVGPAVDEATVGGERLGDIVPAKLDVDAVSGAAVTATDGTAARTLADRWGDVANVLNYYGCDPTGVADCSTQLQAAFDSGKPVFLPAGTYKFGTGLTLGQSVHLYGAGLETVLHYTGTGNAITISAGTDGFSFRHMAVQMTGDGAAFFFGGSSQNFVFDNVHVLFPDYAGTTARIGYKFDVASGDYVAFGTWIGTRVFSAGYGVYVAPTSAEVNALTFVDAEWGACLHGVYTEASHSQWTFVGGSCEAPSNGQNQMVFKAINGLDIHGTRFETKKVGGWDAFVAGDYSTHNPIHIGSSGQKVLVVGASFFPHTTGRVYYCEGIRDIYIHGQDGYTSRGVPPATGFDIKQSAQDTWAFSTRTTQQTGQTGDLETWRRADTTTASGVSKDGVHYDTYFSQAGSGAATIDASKSSFQNYSLTGNVTSVDFTNGKAGQELTLRLVYNGGNYTVAGWNANIRFAGGSFTATSLNNKADVLTFRYNGSVWMEVSRSLSQTPF